MNLATYRTQAVQRFFKLNSYLFSMLSNFARLQSVSLQREKLLEGDSEKFFALFTAISQVSTCHI